MNYQIEYFANQVKSDPKLKNGFNVIGHSQGEIIIPMQYTIVYSKYYNYLRMSFDM
jgi:hypothetical protein